MTAVLILCRFLPPVSIRTIWSSNHDSIQLPGLKMVLHLGENTPKTNRNKMFPHSQRQHALLRGVFHHTSIVFVIFVNFPL